MNYTNAEITERRAADQPDAKTVQTYRAYAEGRHNDVLSTDQKRLLEQRTSHDMTDNVLDLILKTTASRLKLTGWEVSEETPRRISDGSAVEQGEVEQVTAFLDGLWRMNRLPRLQYETHYAELRDGQSAISLGWRNGRVHLWREPWWDGEAGVYIAYDDAGEYEFAVKEWTQRNRNGDEIKRRTVYEAGKISRWRQDGKGWIEYDADTEPAEITLTRRGGDPLPIPLVHFPNGTTVGDSVYGLSEVAGLLALQDDLNATQLDISAASMLTAFQRLFASGLGEVKKLLLSPGSVFGVSEEGARLTVVPAGDLGPLMDTHHFKRDSMSVTARVPVHSLTGDWPSGAALLRAEMPLIEKIEAMADVNGPQWTMVAHRAMELSNALGGTTLDEDVPLTSVFAPAERIDDLTDLEIRRQRAETWEILSRLPKAAMIEAGVEEDIADTIIAQRDEDGRRALEMAVREPMLTLSSDTEGEDA